MVATNGIWTHGEGAAEYPHQWAYLGKGLQTYRCWVCQMRVSKATLKAQTEGVPDA